VRTPHCCSGEMAHIRQSRPDSGLASQVKVLKTIYGVPSSLGSACTGKFRPLMESKSPATYGVYVASCSNRELWGRRSFFERRGDNLNSFNDFRPENGSSQGQNLVVTGLYVPSSLDSSGTGTTPRLAARTASCERMRPSIILMNASFYYFALLKVL